MKINHLYKQILKTALPVVGEMSLNTLLQVADTILISYIIGKSALSAAGYVNQIVYMLIFIFTAFNVGATAMISRSLGEKNDKRINQVAAQAMGLSLFLGVFIGLISYIFRAQIFGIFDLTPEVDLLLNNYFVFLAPGFLPMFAGMTLAAVFRGMGNMKTPLMLTAVSNLINIVGNYVLMTGFGPFPDMGIAGSSLATTIARYFALIVGVWLLMRMRKLKLQDAKPTLDVYQPLMKISIPSAIEQFFMQISFVIVGVMISGLDTNSEAGYRVIANIESLSFMPAVGLAIAGSTLVGKALGERDKDKAWQIGKAVSKMGALWGILIGLVFFLLPSPIIHIFSSEADLVKLCIPVLMIAGFNQPFLNFLISTSGVVRGAGETKPIMIITMVRLWFILVPLTYVLVNLMHWDLKGAFIAETTAFMISTVILFILFEKKHWLNREL